MGDGPLFIPLLVLVVTDEVVATVVGLTAVGSTVEGTLVGGTSVGETSADDGTSLGVPVTDSRLALLGNNTSLVNTGVCVNRGG
jgi:hypothetical protein